MNSGKMISPRPADFVPPREFGECIRRYNGIHKACGFSRWERCLCMAHARLTRFPILMTAGRIHAVDGPGHLIVAPGVICVAKRGCLYFARLSNTHQAPAFFVTPAVTLLFKWIKQRLRDKPFPYVTVNAVKIRIGVSISVYIRLAGVKRTMQLAQGPHTV